MSQRPATPPTSPRGLVKPKKRAAGSLSQSSSGSLAPLQGSQANGSQPASSPEGAAKKRPRQMQSGGSQRVDGQKSSAKDSIGRQRSETVSPGKRARAVAPASPAKHVAAAAAAAATDSTASPSPSKRASQSAVLQANTGAAAGRVADGSSAGQPKQPKKAGRAVAGGGFRKQPPTLLNPKARALADMPPGAAAAAARSASTEIIAANGLQMSNPALMKVSQHQVPIPYQSSFDSRPTVAQPMAGAHYVAWTALKAARSNVVRQDNISESHVRALQAKKQRSQPALTHEAELGPPPQPMPVRSG